jgi:hypothetical protein
MNAASPYEVWNARERTEHRQIAQAMIVLAFVVVNEPNRIHAELRIQEELLHDHLAGGTGARDENMLLISIPAPASSSPSDTNQKAWRRGSSRRQERIKAEH